MVGKSITLFPYRRICVLDRNFLSTHFVSIFTFNWRWVTLELQSILNIIFWRSRLSLKNYQMFNASIKKIIRFDDLISYFYFFFRFFTARNHLQDNLWAHLPFGCIYLVLSCINFAFDQSERSPSCWLELEYDRSGKMIFIFYVNFLMNYNFIHV